MTATTTPRSIEAEQSVLGALMVEPLTLDRIGRLEPRHFFDARHQAIFAAIAGLIGAGKPADAVSVYAALGGAGRDETHELIGYLTAMEQAAYNPAIALRHAEIVRERSSQRALLAAADQAQEVARDDSLEVAAKVDQIVSVFSAIQREQVRKMPRSLAEIAIERTAHYEALERGEVEAGWPTHIPTLDAMLNGGLRPGALYIVAARPSVGKSSFSQALGLTMAKAGRPVLFLSQEMADTEVADRAVANLGRIDYAALQSGRMEHDDWTRAVETMDQLRSMPYSVDDQGSLSLLDIRAKARSVSGLRVLIVDYLQLCSSSRKDGNRNAEIEEISRGLKSLAKELGVAVIALSQLNRQVEQRSSKRPTLSDLRDSGAIEQDADVVLFLWPVSDPAGGSRVIGCGIDKNRQGRCGQFGLQFFGATQQWVESTVNINESAAQAARAKKGDL